MGLNLLFRFQGLRGFQLNIYPEFTFLFCALTHLWAYNSLTPQFKRPEAVPRSRRTKIGQVPKALSFPRASKRGLTVNGQPDLETSWQLAPRCFACRGLQTAGGGADKSIAVAGGNHLRVRRRNGARIL